MKRASVMVVDTDRGSLSRTTEILVGAGHRVIARSVGIGTGGAILRARPEVVLVDLAMPLLDGSEIVAMVRRSKLARETRIVLCGERPTDELAVIARGCRADAWLSKPLDPLELLATIRPWLGADETPSTSRSGTRRLEGYVLVAGDHVTRRILRGTLGARAPAIFTDSGTEALRMIFSPDAPRMVVVGTSLMDLPFDVVWREAVERDPSWRERLVIAEEMPEDSRARALPPGMRFWEREEDVNRLIALYEQHAVAV